MRSLEQTRNARSIGAAIGEDELYDDVSGIRGPHPHGAPPSARALGHGLDLSSAWAVVADLSRTLATASERSIEEALDALVDALGAHRVVVLSGEHAEHVRFSRRAASEAHADEREDVCRSVIEEALARDHVVQRAAEAEPEDSIKELGLVHAMAAPLRGARGALYAEFRHPLFVPTETHRELLSCAAPLLAAALATGGRNVGERAVESERLEASLDAELPLDVLLDSAGLRELRGEVEACLRLRSPILVVGESGTGKTLLARALARESRREPIVRAMLGASDDLNTIASELFGHERGAFSGATSRRAGLVELADGGTLILDEVLNLPLHAQQVLLDLTQFGTYRPLGWQGCQPKHADVRIIAATNGDLERAVEEGRFRRDLYYRLAGTVIRVPPLRERRADVPAIALGCLRRLDASRRWTLSVAARRLLRSPDLGWPGNVRELESVLARACARARGGTPSTTQLRPEHFDPAHGAARVDEPRAPRAAGGRTEESLAATWQRLVEERAALESAERAALERAVEESHGILAHAARALGMPRTTLISRLARAGIAVR